MEASEVPFTVEHNAQNHFAWARTLMGIQRTHMAAVRTSVALIGFGFTVAQFFEHLENRVPPGARRLGTEGPRNLGLLLIASGVVSLAIFTLQYSRAIAYLKGGPFAELAGIGKKYMTAPVYLISYTVMLIGVAAFVSVLVRY